MLGPLTQSNGNDHVLVSCKSEIAIDGEVTSISVLSKSSSKKEGKKY